MSPKNVLPYAAATDPRRQRAFFFLGLAVGCAGFAMALQTGLNDNFLVQDIGASPWQKGILEAARESCGILAFVLLALLAGLAEPIIAMAMLLVFAVGVGSYFAAPTFGWVVLASVVWSQGLHIWMPLPNSMALSLAEPGRTGHRVGQLQAANAAGMGLGLVAGLVLTMVHVPIRPMYLVAGAVAVAGALACWPIPRDIKTPGPRLVFRRRYGLYYLLCFLEGWRKQIFLCFAGFLLVRNYGTPLRTMLLLWGTCQAINYVAAPWVGRLIDRIGERRVLTFYYACLAVFFAGYATITNRWVLYVIFVIDNAFFVFSMALTTYVNRIAPPSEHTPTLSMGVAANHVAAVAMPLVGGLAWYYWGFRWPFLIGAAAAAASILATLRLPAGSAHTPPDDQPPASAE